MSKAPINWTNMLLFSLTPLFAVTLVPLYGYFYGYDLFEWAVFALFMAFCGFSITAGYHRLWSHKAYKAHPAIKVLFALGGACALQNDVLTWASDHRRHHLHVDDNDRDPYSAGRGFWFSHIGWILRRYPSGLKDLSNVKDLQKDPILRWQSRHYLSLVLIMNIALPALIGWLHGDLLASLLLAGLLRLVLSQHVTYLINSLAHKWGRQPYSIGNSARDNGLLALITYGEGYHNYHHAFQWDYRNGIRWWQWDPTKWLIRGLSLFGLTRDLRRCNPASIEAARVELQFQQAAAKCDLLKLPEKWRDRLEQEYQELRATLKLWNRHRISWYEAKSHNLQESLSQFDLLLIRDAYREMHYKLKFQRKRWEFMLQNLTNPGLAGA
ncbi:MAG: fatty acid desaturase [Gammaproteobacteria bacterium]